MSLKNTRYALMLVLCFALCLFIGKADTQAVVKKAAAKPVKKLGKVIFEIDGQQIDFKAIEKKASKLGGNVYVVIAEKKIYDADGNSVDLF